MMQGREGICHAVHLHKHLSENPELLLCCQPMNMNENVLQRHTSPILFLLAPRGIEEKLDGEMCRTRLEV